MGFRKYQKTEKDELVSKEGHKAIEDELHKVGKSSMTQVDDKEKQRIASRLDG